MNILGGKLEFGHWAELIWNLDSAVHHAALDVVRFAALVFAGGRT